MAKKTSLKQETGKGFEEYLKEIESIVDKLESGELNLDASIALYERGMELVEKLPDVEALIVDTTGAIHQSTGFEKNYLR